MKKENLKSGMLVQFRKGDIRMLINNTFVSSRVMHGFSTLDEYDDNLKRKYRDNAFDIVKVSKLLSGGQVKPNMWTLHTLHQNLLWEDAPKKDVIELKINGIEYDICPEVIALATRITKNLNKK